jgi:hypothetical protein
MPGSDVGSGCANTGSSSRRELTVPSVLPLAPLVGFGRGLGVFGG